MNERFFLNYKLSRCFFNCIIFNFNLYFKKAILKLPIEEKCSIFNITLQKIYISTTRPPLGTKQFHTSISNFKF